jgi:hypothetical protein
MKPDTKEFKEQELEATEEKLQLDDKHNVEHKSGCRSEVRDVIDMLPQSYFTICIEKNNNCTVNKNFFSSG